MTPEYRSSLLAPDYEQHLPPLFQENPNIWKPKLELLTSEIYKNRGVFMNEPLDPPTLPAVLGLRLLQFETFASCGGHIETNEALARDSAPYIEIRYPPPWPQYENEKEFWINFCKRKSLNPNSIFPQEGRPQISYSDLGQSLCFAAFDELWAWQQFQQETEIYANARLHAYKNVERLGDLLQSFYAARSQDNAITIHLKAYNQFLYFLSFEPKKNIELLVPRQKEMLAFGEYLLATHLINQGRILSI